jgi:predicted deacylase
VTGNRRRSPHRWDEVEVAPGQSVDVHLEIGASYSGAMLHVPVHVQRGEQDGPALLVTAALHGDEINGTGAIRHWIQSSQVRLLRGTLLLVPVLNVLSFERHSRYLPDRRDLNRCFPGSQSGSLASRMAHTVLDQLISRCDFGIDLHTAAVRRTNFPNVRADLTHADCARLAHAFGSQLILDGPGQKGTLRRAATLAGCPTITFEGGEVWKVERTIVECIERGIDNVLRELRMIDGPRPIPVARVLQKTKWIRAECGGFLQFHVAPGDLVSQGQPLATNTSLLGHELNTLNAPFDAIVIGMSTLPAVSPGEPVCHLGKLPKSVVAAALAQGAKNDDQLHRRVQDELATNVMVVEPPGPAGDGAS